MALRAGYYGLKKKLLEKVTGMPAIKSIGSGLALNSSTGELSATGVEVSITGNPEGEVTAGNLTKLQIGDDIFNVPDTTYSNATTTTAGLMSAGDKTKLNGLNKDNYFLRSEQTVLGAKNRLNIPSAVVTKTENGVTFTVTRDGSGYVTEIDVDTNGAAASDGTQLNLSGGASATVKNTFNGLKLVGCPEGGTNETYKLLFWDDSTTEGYSDYGEGVIITAPNNNDCYLAIVIRAGAVCNHLKFYPMVIEASDPDDTYAPYAMTNRELTEELKNFEQSLISTNEHITIDSAAVYKWGRYVNMFFQLKCSTTIANTDEALFTLPVGCRPSALRLFRTYDVGSSATSESHLLSVATTGNCTLKILNSHNVDRWIRAEVSFMSAS